MFEKFLTKEEKRLFSKKNKQKLKRKDFYQYLKMEVDYLDSLKAQQESSKEKNPILDKEIKEREELVAKLNWEYYNVVLLDETISTNDFVYDEMLENFDDDTLSTRTMSRAELKDISKYLEEKQIEEKQLALGLPTKKKDKK